MDRTRLATFRLDVEYTRIAAAFVSAGIGSILLKGPAFDQLLFGGTRSRGYSDIDLLIDPAERRAAQSVMEQQGFRKATPRSPMRRLAERALTAAGVLTPAHASTWIRERDRFTVDVHDTLPLLGVSPAEAWAALSAHRATITVVGAEVEAFDPTASALLIALHAAHHGPHWTRARIDVQRACEVLQREVWEAAVRLARDLRTADAMGIGLGTTGEGCALAHALGLRTRPTAADRLRWWGSAWTERARAARGSRRSPPRP
jgi:hypothetical protein